MQDDAFTIEEFSDHNSAVNVDMNGGIEECSFRLGVHITDVNHFVLKNDENDMNAAAIEGGYRTHNGEYRKHMLPENIREHCALRKNTQKVEHLCNL